MRENYEIPLLCIVYIFLYNIYSIINVSPDSLNWFVGLCHILCGKSEQKKSIYNLERRLSMFPTSIVYWCTYTFYTSSRILTVYATKYYLLYITIQNNSVIYKIPTFNKTILCSKTIIFTNGLYDKPWT